MIEPPVEVPDAAATGTVELLFEMRAAQVDPETRRPWHLVYCVDVSGSMSGEKISFVRDALARSLDHFRPGDTLSLITFGSSDHTIFVERSWPEDEAAIRADFAALVPLDSGIDALWSRPRPGNACLPRGSGTARRMRLSPSVEDEIRERAIVKVPLHLEILRALR